MNKIETHPTPDTLALRNDEANLRELTATELDQIEGGLFKELLEKVGAWIDRKLGL